MPLTVLSRRGASLALVGAVALADHLIPMQELPLAPRALMDEPCHLATAAVVLGALLRWRARAPGRWFVWTMLSASVLTDLDHLPRVLGSSAWTVGTSRPYTHALWLAAALAMAAILAGRRSRRSGGARASTLAGVAAGAAWGVSAHFLRDVATAPIALWWPLSDTGVQAPYSWYLAALLVLAATPGRRRAQLCVHARLAVAGRICAGVSVRASCGRWIGARRWATP